MALDVVPRERELPNLSVLVGSLMVFGLGAVFSLGGLAFRLTDDVTAWQYIVFRGLGALVASVAMLGWRYRSDVGELLGSIAISHVIAGLLLGGMSTIFIVSLEHASVAFVLFLQTLAPLTAAYFSWLLLRERVSGAVLIATAVSLVGVAVMVSGTFTDRIEPLGLIAITIPVSLGLYASLIRRATQIDPRVPVLIAAATLVFAGGSVSLLSDGLDVSARDAAIGLVAGAILLAIPASLLNLAARVVPAPETSMLLMSEVVLAPVWVWVFVDEQPETTTLIGGAIILAAVTGLLAWRRMMQITTKRLPPVRP